MLALKSPQIKVNHLGFHYEDSDKHIFKDICFSIKEHESILLLGPSGSGKSTLAFCLNKLFPEAVDGSLKGEIYYDGKKLEKYISGELNQRIGVVFQDPESQFCMETVEDEIAFGLENINVPRDKMEEKINQALDWVGLSFVKKELIYSLSGGQKQKLALACVLSLLPEVIILDEPTANLDPQSTLDLVKTIKRLKKEYPFTLIVIEHKLDDWLEIIERCLVLNSVGELFYDGNPRTCFTEKALSLKREGIWLPKVVDAGLQAKNSGIFKGESLPLYLDELINGLTGNVNVIKKERKSLNSNILEISNLHFTRKDKTILKEISFSVKAGEIVAIVGANGSGKTTLSKCIAGLLPISDGAIFFKDELISDWNERKLWKKLGYVFQNPEHQFVTDTVYDEIAFDLRLDKKPEHEIRMTVSSILEKTFLEKLVDVHPFSLSQGQKRRLSVATMLVNEQELLILDEPTFGQDAKTAKEMMNHLVEKTKQSGSALIITHDMDLVDYYVDRVLVLNNGEIIYFGTPESLWKNKKVMEQSKLKLPFVKQLDLSIVGDTYVTS